MCRLCGHHQAQRGGQGRDATRGLRSHEKEAAHRTACVRLPISNYLHTRVAFGVRSILESHGAGESREFSIRGIIVNRASLFISVIIARNFAIAWNIH